MKAQNDLDEFYCMFNFCAPDLLGTQQAFKRGFILPILASRDPKASPSVKATGEERSAALSAMTAPFMLRRTAALMEHYMPPKRACQPLDLPETSVQRSLCCSAALLRRNSGCMSTCSSPRP